MSKYEKLIERMLSNPKDFTWDELVRLLEYYGYSERKKGKTGGSRRKFVDEKNAVISLHKPHPGNIMKVYAINLVIDHLVANGKLTKNE